MENTYSLSDIAAASKNNDYDGFWRWRMVDHYSVSVHVRNGRLE